MKKSAPFFFPFEDRNGLFVLSVCALYSSYFTDTQSVSLPLNMEVVRWTWLSYCGGLCNKPKFKPVNVSRLQNQNTEGNHLGFKLRNNE